jgi:hypothetical protein
LRQFQFYKLKYQKRACFSSTAWLQGAGNAVDVNRHSLLFSAASLITATNHAHVSGHGFDPLVHALVFARAADSHHVVRSAVVAWSWKDSLRLWFSKQPPYKAYAAGRVCRAPARGCRKVSVHLQFMMDLGRKSTEMKNRRPLERRSISSYTWYASLHPQPLARRREQHIQRQQREE